MPDRLLRMVRSYTSDDRSDEEHSSEWSALLKDYFLKIAIYGSIMLVAALAGTRLLYPALSRLAGETASRWISIVLIYAVLIVFAGPFMGRKNAEFTSLWMKRLTNRPPLAVMTITKVIMLELIALIPLLALFDIGSIWIILLIPLSIFAIARSEFISTYYLQLETRFFANLNQKTMDERGEERDNRHWLNEDYSIFSWVIPAGAPYEGKALIDLEWGKAYSVYAVKLKKGDKITAMPPARTILQAGDKLHVIGEKQSLEAFRRMLGIGDVNIRTLKDFLVEVYNKPEHALACAAIRIRGTESYVGKPIKKSGINAHGRCMILGIERNGYAVHMPDANMLIEQGDILWLIGTERNLQRIASHSVGEIGSHAREDEKTAN